MALDRRKFLKGTAAAVGGGALASPFAGVVAQAGAGPKPSKGYGPLVPTPDHRDGVVRLDLPQGFQYRSFHPTGTVLADGTALPGRHDGMHAFAGPRRDTVALVRNHEVNGPVGAFGPIGDPTYDPETGGGTVTAVVTRHGVVLDDWVSLNGTQMNCSGGRTPWGSWLSAEETVNGDDVGSDFTGQSNEGLAPHGYLFEVPARGRSTGDPIRAAGRFAHEAAAVDPASGYVYLTEDNFNFPSGFYRYQPPENPLRTGHLADGGTLWMLRAVPAGGGPKGPLDLSGPQDGAQYQVEWVQIDDPDPTFPPGTTNDQAIVAVGDQGRAKGGATFSRLEGCTYDRGIVYFVSTQGGAPHGNPVTSGFGQGRGQVWAYDPSSETLRNLYESPGQAVLDLPDNVTASRRGALVLCEDGSGDNFLRGLTREGALFDFARNADPAQVGQEFAGATFSPTFQTLFVNIQSSTGYSLAIWGPWSRGPFG